MRRKEKTYRVIGVYPDQIEWNRGEFRTLRGARAAAARTLPWALHVEIHEAEGRPLGGRDVPDGRKWALLVRLSR